jgi:predicted AlkP superfamily pyrophosphatase or phosphodiesterase
VDPKTPVRGIVSAAAPRRFVALCLAAALCLTACVGNPAENAGFLKNRPEPAGGRPGGTARRVVFIGFDGWGGAYTAKAQMPAIKRMIARGAATLEARCVLPSVSWPNWSSLFSGTPPELRGGNGNGDTLGNFPTIFSALREQRGAGPGMVFFYEWNVLGGICGEGPVEKQTILSDRESALGIAAYIREKKPALTAVVFNEPDSTGHARRWGSAAYHAKLTELDALAAIIEEAVRDAGLYDETVFVLSSDHGGSFWGHGYDLPKQRAIPLIFYGPGIKRGFAIASPVSICDIAPTMAAILGLEAPPQWAGRVLSEIFTGAAE